MKLFLLTLAFVGLATAFLEEEFSSFKDQYGKNYESAEEEAKRLKIFQENVMFIERHNEEFANGKHTYVVAINQFADLSVEEFSQLYTGTFITNNSPAPVEDLVEDDALPATVDWRQKGYVTPVKDQGQCGSCWAFSATGSMEGAHFKKTQKLVSLSEQNLVDCDTSSDGCGGGLMDNAFSYVMSNKGIDTEASYPYAAKDQDCQFKSADIGATITNFKDIPTKSEKALKAAVASVGPVSVAIDASHMSFQFYKKGVYTEPECSQSELDHGVLAVGYGTEAGADYWLVKNSWNTSWGSDGYIKMSRNNNNMCGIATQASYPIA